jgi:hypothetical protein
MNSPAISRMSPFNIHHPKSGSWTGRSVWFLGCRARRNDAEWSFHSKELQRCMRHKNYTICPVADSPKGESQIAQNIFIYHSYNLENERSTAGFRIILMQYLIHDFTEHFACHPDLTTINDTHCLQEISWSGFVVQATTCPLGKRLNYFSFFCRFIGQ